MKEIVADGGQALAQGLARGSRAIQEIAVGDQAQAGRRLLAPLEKPRLDLAGVAVRHANEGRPKLALAHRQAANILEQLLARDAAHDGLVGLKQDGVQPGKPGRLFLGQLFIGDVAGDAGGADNPTLPVVDGSLDRFQPPPCRQGLRPLAPPLVHDGKVVGAVSLRRFVGKQVQIGFAGHGVGRQAELPGKGFVDGHVAPLPVLQPCGVGDVPQDSGALIQAEFEFRLFPPQLVGIAANRLPQGPLMAAQQNIQDDRWNGKKQQGLA